jgi:hypothetical protein
MVIIQQIEGLSRRQKKAEQLIAPNKRALRGFCDDSGGAAARLSPCQCLEDFHPPDKTVVYSRMQNPS